MIKLPQRTRLHKVIAWARQGLCSWKHARKAAVRHCRKGLNPSQTARLMGTSRQWVTKWWNRFKTHGKTWASLDDRSSRPHRFTVKRHAHKDEILEAKTRHPHLGALKLKLVHQIPLSHTTINRVLQENGKNRPHKNRKPWRKIKRFQRRTPNHMWQLDITQVPLKSGPYAFIATLLDDCTRFVLASRTFHKELTTADVLPMVREAIRLFGKPQEILTDRGCQFHTNSDFPSLFTLALHQNGIRHIMARPRHPRTIGKIERWHRSLKEEWLDRHNQPETIKQLQETLNQWVEHYNAERPHHALHHRTPAETYVAGFMMADDLYRLVNGVA